MKKIENMKEIEIVKEYMEFGDFLSIFPLAVVVLAAGAFALILGIVNIFTKTFSSDYFTSSEFVVISFAFGILVGAIFVLINLPFYLKLRKGCYSLLEKNKISKENKKEILLFLQNLEIAIKEKGLKNKAFKETFEKAGMKYIENFNKNRILKENAEKKLETSNQEKIQKEFLENAEKIVEQSIEERNKEIQEKNETILATGAAAAIGLVGAAGISIVADKISKKNN
jgi:hypothetical protein